jgi:hypothetical protein
VIDATSLDAQRTACSPREKMGGAVDGSVGGTVA